MSYGYNKYSNSNMSSRGRGFNSRGGGGGGGGGGGSYRGRGGGGSGSSGNWDSSSGGSNMSRGGYGSSRGGRFKYSTPNYDSRNKYNSSGGSDRSYSSRGGGRGDHSNNYKRARDSYSSRDDHRSSSESNRKRVRNDSYQGEGSSGSQRYGTSSYGSSATSTPYNDNKRSSSSAAYDDKRQSDRSSSYHRTEDRHSSTSRNYAAPPPPRISDMAPPSQRYTSSRGRISHQSSNYRGRISTRGRGTSFRVGASRSELMMSRKRALTSTLEYRRKLLTSRSRDYIQRVRLASTKMRRSGTTRQSGSKKESTTSSSIKDKDRELVKAINAEFSDDDEDKDAEENWEVDDKTVQTEEDEEVTNNDAEKKSKDEKRKKDKPERQSVDEREEEKDQEMKEGDDEVKQEREEDEVEGEREENEKEEGSADGLPSRRDGRRFIKLHCPHCAHRSVTFKEYSLHLFSGRHNTAMRRIAARHKANLARMRVLQRQEQRRHEAREASRGTLPSRTMFCQICKLNYRSMKAMHHMSDSHRQMKRFLTPFCRVCRIQFRSPMLFETHVCSLDHIKRKNLLDDRLTTGNGDAEGDSSGPGEDDKEVNLDNFMTLDSVGDVDAEEDEEAAGDKKKKDKPEGSENNTSSEVPEKKLPKNKQMIKVGAEYVKLVEAQFCELCKMYLPRNENIEKALAFHCSTRSHLKRYVRDNDDKALRRQAERIHLQTSTPSVNNTSATSTTSETTKPTSSSPTPTNDDANLTTSNADISAESEQTNEQPINAMEIDVNKSNNPVDKNGEEEEEDDFHNDGDKLWEDVDKDLGDILREVEPGKSSDDEDSRYDRFKNSEKKIQQLQHLKEKANDLAEIEESKKLETKNKIEKIEK